MSDCKYICNYAQELYDKWQENTNNCVRYNMYNKNPEWQWTQGPCTLYPPSAFNCLLTILEKLRKNQISDPNDDTIITQTLKENKFYIDYVYRGHKFCFKFHNETGALHNNRRDKNFINCYN